MHIAHFLTSVDAATGGPARLCLDLAAGLAARGHRVTVMRVAPTTPAPAATECKPAGFRIVDLPAGVLAGTTLSHLGTALLDSELAGVDLLHLHGVWEYANVQAGAAATRLGLNYVVTPHGMLDRWPMSRHGIRKRAYLAACGTRWLSAAARIHFTAQAERQQSDRWVGGAAPEVIPNLLDLTPFRALPDVSAVAPLLAPLEEGVPRVLFLSRIDPKKGLETLLDAMGLLRRQGSKATLVVAGSGDPAYVASLRRRALQRGLTDRDVAFVGMVTGARKLALFRACQLFALPTKHENFGFALVEALACGLPVVTTRAVGIWPELQASGGAEIVPASPASFAERICALLTDPARLRERGAAGRRWALDSLDAAIVLPQYEAMYRSACGDSARRRA